MKLYVCWGTFRSPRPGGHPCGNAFRALQAAGHDPEVEKVYGLGLLPDALNPSGRKKLKEMTGSSWAPVLETDDGQVIAARRRSPPGRRRTRRPRQPPAQRERPPGTAASPDVDDYRIRPISR